MERMATIVRTVAAIAVGAALIVSVTGCTRVELTEDDLIILGDGDRIVGHEKDLDARESFDLPTGAREAEIDLEMGLGDLLVEGGARSGVLAEGDFQWSVPELRPRFTQDVSLDTAELRIRHGEGGGIRWPSLGDAAKSSWQVRLTDELPLSLVVGLGVGETDLVLEGLDITDLKVDMGVGDCRVDLTGDWERSFDAHIAAGVGSLTVIVPKDVGVRVSGRDDGLGSYSADGFIADGDTWVNSAWGEADIEIDILLSRGVGDVRLVLDD